jgi:hypothetical protein
MPSNGRYSTRSAVSTFLENAIGTLLPSYVTQVYAGRAYVKEQDYVGFVSTVSPNPNGSSAVLCVVLPSEDNQTNWTLTGVTSVNNELVVPVDIEIYFSSNAEGSINPTGLPGIVQAQYDYDFLVDSLRDLIALNPNFGSSAIWMSGKDAFGIKHSCSEPWSPPESPWVYITGVVQFQATCQVILNAPVE